MTTFWLLLGGFFWSLLLILGYATVTYLFSQDWVLGWVSAFGCLILARVLWRFFSATLIAAQAAFAGPAPRKPNAAEREAQRTGWRLALLGVGFYMLLCSLDALKSPATFVSFLFYGSVIAYTLVSLFLHRSKLIVAAGLLTALILSVQPYHFRFPGLTEYYRGRTEEGESKKLCWLSDTKEKDRLKAFAQGIEDYQKFAAAVGITDAYMTWRDSSLEDKQENEPRLIELLQKANVQKQRDGLLELWRKCEDQNRVIAPQIPDEDSVLALLRNPSDPGNLPVTSKPLLPIEDFVSFPGSHEQGKPVVIVAISGGGIRSAAWAFTVLKEIEVRFAEKGIDFPRHVRIVTGASGGMLGASYYIDLLPAVNPDTKKPPVHQSTDGMQFALEGEFKNKWESHAEHRREFLRKRYCENLTQDGLTPIMQQMVLGDIPSLFSPWPSKHDRGKAVEDAWVASMGAGLDRSFADIRDDEANGKRPFLIFSPMLVEDGRRLLISNMDLRHVVQNTGNLIEPGVAAGQDPTRRMYSREALELFRLFPKADRSFKLKTAIRMSASFPFFSPATPLPTTPRRRVVDAGYYDNYGISLAASWLFSRRGREAMRKDRPRYLIIQIRDSVSEGDRTLTHVPSSGGSGNGRLVDEVGSPIEGLYNSRDGSSSFRNDGQLELLSTFMNSRDDIASDEPPEKLFNVATFELTGAAPLSWYLNTHTRNTVWRSICNRTHQERIRALIDWWPKPKVEPKF